jgi:DNA-binding NtrC family response regulator
MYKVLVVDDDYSLHEALSRALRDDYELACCTEAGEAIKFLSANEVDVVLLDLDLPDGWGTAVLDETSKFRGRPSVIMLTGTCGIPTVVDSIRRGAVDYLTKPYSIMTLKNALDSAVAKFAVMRSFEEGEFKSFVGLSDAIADSRRLISMYAKADFPVIVYGESGTGKNVAAQAIHRLSSRRSKKFVCKNIAAYPIHLLESELFGTERGAFTDAVSRAGCFEEASGGTLFLDEIGDLELSAQIRLLRILETKTVRRLGGVRDIPIDIRVILATNQNLAALVKERKFRADLYYRIDGLTLTLPPLREREGDILVLTEYFLNTCGRTKLDITYEAVERLLAHDWPGNVRELKAVIERATVLSGSGKIDGKHIWIGA